MKLQEQVITLEQAKRLFELGLHLNSQFAWCWNGVYMDGSDKGFFINLDGFKEEWPEAYCAYTVAELGVMLPTAYDSMRLHEGWRVYDEDGNDGTGKDELFNTEAQARGKLLIYLLETGIITAEQCNTALAA